ncbi:MAG: hypothetical protein JRI40_10560 [Deltaproteobacteria bacterium]|nr:hypothetical protein [Deltaproteobacteria bacterium]
MNEKQSIVKKTESALDDLLDLWRRRKLICIIVIAVIALPGGFTLYQQFVALPKLKSQVSTLETQKKEAEQKRDKAELQLAPFLATAKARFPDVPPDKRLELLLKKMEQAVTDVQDAARRIGKDRVLSDYLIKKVVPQLKHQPKMTVSITCVMGDTDGFALAKQLENIFTQAGWPMSDGGVAQALFTAPQKDVQFVFRQDQAPSAALQQPLLEILDAIGQEKRLYIDPNQPKDNLKIVVGSK